MARTWQQEFDDHFRDDRPALKFCDMDVDYDEP
jgi:hypothetical protein